MLFSEKQVKEIRRLIFMEYPQFEIDAILSLDKNKYSDFAFLWIYYNAKYNSLSENTGRDEKKATNINNFKLSKEDENRIINDALSKFEQIPWPESAGRSGKRIGILSANNGSLEAEFSSENKNLKALLTAIYKLRCNLIHGSKVNYPSESDEPLIHWACKCLKELMGKSQA